jgi:hypothetical protein
MTFDPFMDQNEIPQTISKFARKLSIFISPFWIIYLCFLIFIAFNWTTFQLYLIYFDGNSALSNTIQGWIIHAFTTPNIQDIIGIIVIIIAFLYLTQLIKEEGHVVVEDDSRSEIKYLKGLFQANPILTYIILPLLVFLLLEPNFGKIGEFIVLIALIAFNYFISLKVLTGWHEITNNYQKLVNFKSSNDVSYILRSRDTLASGILFSIILTTIVFLFVWKFNLISIVYIETCLFFDYSIFCFITFNVEGPVDIHLIDATNTNFERAYIFEDSRVKGQIFIITRDNSVIKIYKSSILYMVPSSPQSPSPSVSVSQETS